MAARDDQDPIETLAPDAAHPALRVRLRPRRRDRRSDHPDPLRATETVEGVGELDVAIADQDPRMLPLLAQGDEHVARMLRDPGAVRMGGDTGDVHAAPLELDEEEDVEATQPERIDGEEIALENPGRLLTQ